MRHNLHVAVEPTLRSWEALFAERTRGGAGDGLLQILAMAGAKDVISFAGGFPDPQTFPGPALAEILRELAERGDASPFQYSPTEGLPGPRDYVADRLERVDGRRPEEGELMLTSGAVEAMELVGKAFLDRGDRVLVEAPTYLGAIMAFQSFEAVVEGIPLDEDGLDVDELERALGSRPAPKLLYTIPDFQNPAGVSLSAERREALVELARRHGVLVLEDVAYRELSFVDERPPSLWSLAPELVVQAGTFSKTFFPGVRLGWAAGPAEVVSQLVVAKQNTDQCAGALGQRLFEEYARPNSDGRAAIDEQLEHSRALYRARCERLLAALARTMPETVAWTEPRGGFFTWLTLPEGFDATDFARRAAAAGVAVVPGTPFYPDGRGTANVRLSFSRVEVERIDEGVERLAALVAEGGDA